MALRGCFVTGTDTGAGKTVLAAAIAAALASRGERVAAYKPVLTGLEEPPDPTWPRDHELLAAVTGQRLEEVAPRCFGPPVSPHLAAGMAGEALELHELVDAASVAAEGADALVVEGVGGLLVPLSESASVRDLAREVGLPLVVAARPGLGTINHTLLTLDAARAAHLDVAAVVLTPWPDAPSRMQESNRETIAALGGVEVATLATLVGAKPESLAAAGSALPIASWLAPAPEMIGPWPAATR